MIPDSEYPLVPGRGLLTKNAIRARLEHLAGLGYSTSHLNRYFIDHAEIQNNIESFFGSVEIPVGLVGPLKFNENNHSTFVYTPAGTLEGALIASMNRGSKAISLSGGFTAKVIHQRMLRAPLFMLSSAHEANIFAEWVNRNFENVKAVTEKYSNHAKLIELSTHVLQNNVHVRFVYTTGDAAGQNMTTTCTWHGMLWIVEHFLKEAGIEIPHFVIEGNGSSDKKASRFMIEQGRGVCVEANCFLEEPVIKKVLRTSSEDIFRCFGPSVQFAEESGMLGFNINVANAVAAIFVATGQDLASIHESSVGILNITKAENGLYLSLKLPSLVIGTVGGGTNLSKQHEALEVMECAGGGKIERFASLIAGFSLALEISTYSAIVSGEFAKAHELLGRNKPKNWLQRHEIDQSFIIRCLKGNVNGVAITKADIRSDPQIENGILTTITQRVSKKICGFIQVGLTLENGRTLNVLTKSKAIDLEVIKGLHMMAASVDPQLSDLIYNNREKLEYWNSHYKEIKLYEALRQAGLTEIPDYYGSYINEDREIFLLFQEFFDKNEVILQDSENSPESWTVERLKRIIDVISKVHAILRLDEGVEEIHGAKLFRPWLSKPLYKKMVSIICQETEISSLNVLDKYIDELEDLRKQLTLPTVVIHNDFNPRNVALRKGGRPCIYDWELAVVNIPHRDVVEFLCFAFPLNFEKAVFFDLLEHHFQKAKALFPSIERENWFKGYGYAVREFLVTRAAFYKVSEILMKLKFGDRIIMNGLRMIELLDNWSLKP